MKLLSHGLLLALFIGMVSLRPAAAQETAAIPVPFDGTEAFGHILHSFDLKAISKIEDCAQLGAEKTVVIIFGDLLKLDDTGSSVKTRESLEKFRENGGAILLANDYPDRSCLPCQLSSPGRPVHASGDSIYKDMWEQCPVVTRFSDRAHPLFKDVKKLVTNRPSFLRGNPVPLQRLADFSEDCAWMERGQMETFVGVPAEAGYIFGSARNAPPAGRAVVIAGQGVFLNGMLIQPDNDNFAFAWNTVDWLAEGPGGRRQYALFIDEGKVVDNFALPLSKFGPVPVPRLQIINRMIRGLEEENVFNRLLIDRLGKTPYLRGFLLLLSLAVLLWGAWRIMLGRFRLETGVPLLVGKQQAAPPASPVLWQRREELRRQGNLWEPAQVLARQFFLDHAGLAVPLWDDDSAVPPVVETRGNFWQRRKLTRQVQNVWHMARSSPAEPVSPRHFDDFLRLLSQVTAAVWEKRVVFQ